MPNSPEVYGIGAVAVALTGLIWKIWTDNRKQTDRMIDVLEKNAVANEKLARNVDENTRTTHQQGEATMKVLVKLLQQDRKNL